MEGKQPTIKGMFLNSHIRAVRKRFGERGVEKLRACYGKSLSFSSLQEVLVPDEVRLIHCALNILRPAVPKEKQEFESGVLHFENFATTPLGKLIMMLSRRAIRKTLLQTKYLAPRVFKNVRVETRALGPREIRISMFNNDYPLEHFRGFFTAWVRSTGRTVQVEAQQNNARTHLFTLTWQ